MITTHLGSPLCLPVKINDHLKKLEIPPKHRTYINPRAMGEHIKEAEYGYLDSWLVFNEGEPKFYDIKQGRTGDCYLLGALAGIAANHPSIIASMIQPSDEGSYQVRFYTPLGTPLWIKIDPCFLGDKTDGKLIYAKTPLTQNGDAIIWPALVEKAYAYFINECDKLLGERRRGFDKIGKGGYAHQALFHLTGKLPETIKLDQCTINDVIAIGRNAAQGTVTLVGSKEKDLPLHLQPNHIFTVLGFNEITDNLILYDPHGVNYTNAQKGERKKNSNGVIEIDCQSFLNHFSDATFASKKADH